MPKLIIDRERCLNSGQCAYLQPELFEMDDYGEPRVLNDHPNGRMIARAEDAISMCPAQAISLIDEVQDR